MLTNTSDGIELAVMRTLCKRFKSSYARRVSESLSSPLCYLGLDIDPNDYKDPFAYSKDYLLYSFLRKWKGWKSGIDLDQAAISSWTTAEQSNLKTNLRFDSLSPDFQVSRFISKVKQKIEKVIGSSPCFDQLDKLCKWGPGATFDIRRGNTDAPFKMSSMLSVTQRALPHFNRIIDPKWSEVARVPTVVRGNRCVTVPKNSKTHRMIAAEPTCNSFLQQSVGRFIRGRLKEFGINLSDQKVNQDLAFRSYVDDLSTLDLSMASDTLSSSVVSLLLPYEWYIYLDDLRSPYSLLEGKWYRLEKFSSMGNAFTFELESLIFWALCSVVCEDVGPASVYGDDIIIPRTCFDDVVAVLKYFGFTPNIEKSYRDGYFFESCGKQYHTLEDVTPAYQKEIVRKDLSELVRLHNRLYRWGSRNRSMHLVKDALLQIVSFCKDSHPKLKKLPLTPFIEGDFGFIQDHSSLKRDKNGDFRCRVLTEIPEIISGINPVETWCGLAMKLRDPTFANPSPDGGFSLNVGTRTVLRNTVIWASALA